MMHIKLSTTVNGNYLEVYSRFDADLFKALSPPWGGLKILEFSGSKKGDRVHLELNIPFKAKWIGIIAEDGMDHEKAWFVDEGEVLPFGLKKWKHRHIIKKIDEKHCHIVDDIEYKTSFKLWSWILYMPLYMMFWMRKSVYRSYFSKGRNGNS